MVYRSIMSGERTDVPAIVMRGGLAGLSVPYRVAMAHRNRRYDRGSATVHDCGVPVISVGNLTTGGTGKTPIVCYLANWFRSRGTRVSIVSRGYGRGDADSNDEALELHARLPDVPHVQDPDRVEAARIAVEELETELILMDDGFQHRRLHRDLNIVVVDATCPFGFGHLLPRGLLREPISSLTRADLVIVTRCDAVEQNDIASIEQAIRAVKEDIPILHSNHRPTSLIEYPHQQIPLTQESVVAVSAIGNPDAFEHSLRQCGIEVVDSIRRPDHDPYSPDTVRAIEKQIATVGEHVDRIVCTHKDLVKLQTTRLAGKPLAALLIELTILGDTCAFDQLLSNLV